MCVCVCVCVTLGGGGGGINAIVKRVVCNRETRVRKVGKRETDRQTDRQTDRETDREDDDTPVQILSTNTCRNDRTLVSAEHSVTSLHTMSVPVTSHSLGPDRKRRSFP